ncbi:AIR synthase-related protein [Pseudomonas aeruginosa]
MAFAGHCGVELNLDALADSREELAAVLFSEELGAVIQVREGATPEVLAQFSAAGLDDCVAVIGQPVNGYEINLNYNGETVYSAQRRILQRIWSETSYQIQRLRDNADCAEQEFDVSAGRRQPRAVDQAQLRRQRRHRRALHQEGRAAGKWRSSASRASTARWRWPRRSTAPASPRSTCT